MTLGLTALALAVFFTGAPTQPPGAQSRPVAPPELLARPYLCDVTRHLYRWYLDERDVEALAASGDVVFRVRALQPPMDADDRSRFGEINLPQLGLRVKVKRADYTIPELAAVVKSDTYKIVSVARVPGEELAPPDSTEVRFDYAALRDELYRTRRDASFPEGDLLERLRGATRQALLKDAAQHGSAAPAGPQVVWLAPLSPVANETWVFWESGRRLIRFASDIDLANPAAWAHEELAVRPYDIDTQVVVSLDEVPGSNAYLTRSQVGRALLNCIVLGRRLELQPPADAPASRPADR
jgi:hypothetical protein